MLGNIINYINLFGWLAVLFSSALTLVACLSQPVDVTKPAPLKVVDISLHVLLLQVVQGLQILDILLILIGKSKGSLLSSLAQIVGRLIVAWGFVNEQTDKLSFFLMVFMWSFADTNRYMFYIFRNPISAALRYNLFLILYPVGVTGEMLVINSYIYNNAEWLSIQQINFIRIIQAGIIIGMVFLYIYMLNARRKYYRQQNSEAKIQPEKKVAPKRD